MATVSEELQKLILGSIGDPSSANEMISLLGSGGGGGITQVNSGTGLTGGPITSSGTLSLANTAVTPGVYTNSNLVIDQQGRITAASNGSSVSTLNSLSGALNILAGSGISVTPSGSDITIASSGGSGATVALDNLASTAVNVAINPASDNSITLGTAGFAWNNVQTASVSSANSLDLTAAVPFGTLSLTGGTINATSGVVNLLGPFPSPGTTALTFYDQAQNHNVSLAAPITLTATTAFILPPADGTSGQVLTTDGAGNLSFASAGGGSAVISRVDVSSWSTLGFSLPLPFTSADVTSGFSTALIGTNQFVATSTGIYEIGCKAVSSNFSGVTDAALGYGVNAGFTVESMTTSVPDGIRAVATFVDKVFLNSGDEVSFFGDTKEGSGVFISCAAWMQGPL